MSDVTRPVEAATAAPGERRASLLPSAWEVVDRDDVVVGFYTSYDEAAEAARNLTGVYVRRVS